MPTAPDGAFLDVVVETRDDGRTRQISGRALEGDPDTFQVVDPGTGHHLHRLHATAGPDGDRAWTEGAMTSP
ncbi:hypothetical protein, partial [Escherichia coli]